MSDLTPIYVVFGVLGLIYFATFALLLASCGRLHRLEGFKLWRVAWYSVLIELSMGCLSVLGTAAMLYWVIQLGREFPELLQLLTNQINHGVGLVHTISLGTLTLALAYPLRKVTASSSGIEADLPDTD